jgi:protein-tyrosine phosphatase
MPSVLFVCQGNIFRSPISMATFIKMIPDFDPQWKEWKVESAGTWAKTDVLCSPELIHVMALRGIDLTQHRSRMITAEILANFNLVLVMESGQKEALCIEFRTAATKIFMLSEMANVLAPINDPRDLSENGLSQLSVEIEHWLRRGMPRIIELARKSG